MLQASNQQLLQPQGVVSTTVFSGIPKVLDRRLDNERQSKQHYVPYQALGAIEDAGIEAGMLMFEVMDFASPVTNEQYPHAEVVLNGLSISRTVNPSNEEEVNNALEELESKIRYLGIACNSTPVKPSMPLLTDHNVAQIAGTRSVQNTGLQSIKAGQIIVARLPSITRSMAQIPSDGSWYRSNNTRYPELLPLEVDATARVPKSAMKTLIKTDEFKNLFRAIVTPLINALAEKGAYMDDIETQFGKKLSIAGGTLMKSFLTGVGDVDSDGLKSYMDVVRGTLPQASSAVLTTMSSRIIGTSLNGCEPNEWFDLLMSSGTTQNLMFNALQ